MEIHESDIPAECWQDCGNNWKRACFVVRPSDRVWCGKRDPVYAGNAKWEIWDSGMQTQYIIHDVDNEKIVVTWEREVIK